MDFRYRLIQLLIRVIHPILSRENGILEIREKEYYFAVYLTDNPRQYQEQMQRKLYWIKNYIY